MKRLLCLVAAVLCAFPGSGRAGTAACSPTIFIEAASYPAGAAARNLAIADFDGDTRPDVATGNDNPRSVSVLLNDGAGGLQSPIVTPIPTDAVTIAAGDLRGNGTNDLVVAVYNGIYVLLGHGDGSFDAPVFYDAETSNVYSMVIGTFDANASLDVVLGSYYSSYPISLLPGNGNGTFGTPLLTPAASQVFSLATGDFDTDGHLDLATSGAGAGVVSVYLGFGDGTFTAPSGFIAGASLYGVATGDFDADTHVDLAVASGTSVSILLGNGSGGFEAALQYPANIAAGLLAVADLDQDGVLDIVAAEPLDYGSDSDEVSVLRGRGDGSFDPGEPYSAGGALGLALGDLNGDSLPDVVTVRGDVFVLLDTPDGSLLAVPNSSINGPNNPNFARGDWNGDGGLDFAWVSGNEVLVIEGTGDGRFHQIGTLNLGGPNTQPYGVSAGHFFDSGTTDLVVSVYSDVLLFRGNGDGTFQDPVSIYSGFQLGAIEVGDFDASTGGGDDVVVFQGCCGFGTIVALLGNGDGTFQPPGQTPFGQDVIDFITADFGDAAPLAPPLSDGLAVLSPNSVSVLLSNHDGTFHTTTTVPAANPGGVGAGDFNGGGTDLLVSSQDAHVDLYPGNNDGTFQPPVAIALSSTGGSLAIGAYDDDPYLDFAVQSGSNVLVFFGLGDAHFRSPTVLTTDISATYLASGDFAGSGVEDLAALGTQGIAAFRNSRLGAVAQGGEAFLVGSSVTLHAGASGYGPVTYQWRRDGIPLADGGRISGSQTATLTIDPVGFPDAGAYDVVVADTCTSIASIPALLAVEFADVPVSSPFHDGIIAIATAGITGGCGGADFCPTSPVRRDQMTVFLLKAEHGAAYTPPACSGVFTDVPCPSAFADWVEQLAAEGVTGGCGGGNYCPDASVTRAQMAVFLLKTSQGSGYAPPPAAGIFGDVPVGSFAADFIEDLYSRGITGGCSASPLLYCPNNAVLRQQMATFLVRMFFP